MDENQAFFDNTSKEMPRTPVPKGEKGSGKGLFLAGLIAGLASTLLLVGIVYLGHSIQQIAESRNAAEQVVFEENSAVDASMVAKLQALESIIDQWGTPIPSIIPRRS